MESGQSEIVQLLVGGFDSQASERLSICATFVWGETAKDRCIIAIGDGQAKIVSDLPSELALIFSSEKHLRGLLAGHCNPIELFMQGDFRADGGLPFVLPLLRAFAAAS